MDKIFEHLKSDYRNYLDMLESLVNLDCGSVNKEGVNRVSKLLMEKFQELEGDYKIVEVPQQECGNHVVITKKGKIPGKILVLGHMDTVFPEGTVEKRPFKIEKDKAFGPGVTDMKSGITSIYFALKTLQNIFGDETKTIEVIFNADEEISSINSRKIIEEKALDADCVLVMEPARPNGDVVTGRKGIGKYYMKVKGKASHAGVNPQEGANAIVELSHKIIKLSQLNNYEVGTTVNVGIIGGGTAANTVPDHCEAVIDVRITNMEEGEKIDTKIKEIAGEKIVNGTTTLLEGGIKRPPMERKDGNFKLYGLLKELADELCIEIGETFTGGGSDGNFTSALGVPTLDGLGPIGGGSHGEDEYLQLESIIPRTALLTAFLKKLSHK